MLLYQYVTYSLETGLPLNLELGWWTSAEILLSPPSHVSGATDVGNHTQLFIWGFELRFFCLVG